MPSRIATEFKNKNQMAKGGSNSGASKGAMLEKSKPTVATADGLCTMTEVCAADVFATMSARGRGRAFRSVACSAVRGRGAPSNRGRGKSATELWDPLRWTLLRFRTMRDQDRIPHQTPKADRIPCQGRGMAMTFCHAFSVDSINTRREAAHSR